MGQFVYAEENRVPRAASLSRFGVLTSGCPAQPITRGLCWSDNMIRRFVLCIVIASLRRDVGFANHLAPFHDLFTQVAAEFRAADCHHLARLRCEPLPDLWRLEDRRDL